MISLIVQLIGFSVIPLLGVVFWGWDWREIIIFYWFSNISYGIFTFIDMLRSAPREFTAVMPEVSTTMPSGAQPISFEQAQKIKKIFLLIFFPMHYGIFTLVHGFFIFAFVSGTIVSVKDDSPVDVAAIASSWCIALMAGLVARLLYYRSQQVSPEAIMVDAYRRIVVLQMVIIGGAFLIQMFNLPQLVAVGLVGTHVISELLHFNKSRKAKSGSVVTV